MPHSALPLPSLAALGRKIRVDAMLDHYLEGFRLSGVLEPVTGLPKPGPTFPQPSQEHQP
jgi:hypothetical protein